MYKFSKYHSGTIKMVLALNVFFYISAGHATKDPVLESQDSQQNASQQVAISSGEGQVQPVPQPVSVRVSPITGESMDYAKPNTLESFTHDEFKKVTGKLLVGSMLKPTPIVSINDLEPGIQLNGPTFASQSSQPASIRVYNKLNESIGFVIAKIQDSANESHVLDSIKKAQVKGRGSVIVANGRTKHHYKEGDRRSFIVTKAPDGLAKALEADVSFTARRTALVSLPTNDFLESYKMSHCNVYSPEASLEIDRLGKYIYCRCKKNELDGRLICED